MPESLWYIFVAWEKGMQRIWNDLFERSIMLWLAVALSAVAAIGIGGMALSVIVAERVQGSGSAINVAGSLRRLSHRMGSIVLSDAENGGGEHERLREAVVSFESTLNHDALATMLERQGDGAFAASYRRVRESWSARLKPLLVEELQAPPAPALARHNRLLSRIDEFVEQLNIMVAQLEADTEQRIRQLRAILWGALLLTVVVLLSALQAIYRRVLIPLEALLGSASRIAQGDFDARTSHVTGDELGRLGQAFNTMAEAVSRSHRELEGRVEEKTAELTRSNRSLALLYNAIALLHHAPIAPETYRAMLCDLESLLELKGSLVCLQSRQGEPASLLASSLPACTERGAQGCGACLGLVGVEGGRYQDQGDTTLLSLPLRDKDGLYGVMRLGLPGGARLESWQDDLLKALIRHVGIALGMSHKAEQERLLALQEERSIIARELHDSIAQSLSYMKIQASLLQQALSDPARYGEAESALRDLREGITAAYRQLRELLVTFRLKMQGSFPALLAAAVEEYAARGGLPIHLKTSLDACHLTPNQEIHILQIVREALSNVLRHAHASAAWVEVRPQAGGELQVSIEDDGIGIGRMDETQGDDTFHYGFAIMRERTRGLRGRFDVRERPQGGTLLTLRFFPAPETNPHSST